MAMSQQEKTDYKQKFNEDSYDRIGLYLPKGKEGEPGMKNIWQAAAVIPFFCFKLHKSIVFEKKGSRCYPAAIILL